MNVKVKLNAIDGETIFDSIKACATYFDVSSTSIRNWIKYPQKSKYKLSYI